MQDAKEEVRARLNIEDVIGEYIQLRRAGRNFKGLSPFTGEKTPSFIVSPDKHIWHDFSSNKGGDVFSFIMEVEGLDFREALEHLARKAGVDLSMYESRGGRDAARRKKRLLEAHELAASYFQHSLLKNPRALEYVFKRRRLSKEIVGAFRIGYAPDSGDGLVRFLRRKGFSDRELSDGGLVNRFGGDLFRARMTVPLMDAAGQVIGFTARIIDDDPKAPKYLNTPQTLLYDKSRHVFGLSQAKEAIRKSDYAVIVEGNLDAVSSHQAGIKMAVATAGTAMTEQHLRALVRLSGNIKLAFDGDKAGLAATERAIPIAQQAGAELTIIELPEGAKDPDELIQKDPALWQAAIDSSRPVIDWLLDQYERRTDMTSAAGKRQFSSAAVAIIGRLHDPVEQDHYLKYVAERLDISLDALKEKSARLAESASRPRLKPAKTAAAPATVAAPYQDDLLAAAIIEPSAHDLFSGIDPEIFAGEERRAVAAYLKGSPGGVIKDTPEELKNHDIYVKILLLRAENRYADFSDLARVSEIAGLLRRAETEHKQHQKDELTRQLREAEAAHDAELAARLLKQIDTITKEISSARR